MHQQPQGQGAAAGAASTQITKIQTSPSSAQPAMPQQPGAINYVALGDSVAAGAGLPASASGVANDATCDRSPNAYPYAIARTYQLNLLHLACSGAKVDEGIYGEQTRAGIGIPPQLDVAFATTASPTLMTATIGANDVRWTQFIRQCYAIRCGTSFDDVRAKVYRADLRIELFRMLHQVYTRSGGSPPRVLVSGYYSPINTTDCLTSNRITAEEVTWLKEQTASLNQAIQSIIPYFSFAQYVPIDFTGHELCSADPWVQGVEAEAPVHPTTTGQSAIAQSFIRVLQSQ
jgi:lysophospholipase L1-like esterase